MSTRPNLLLLLGCATLSACASVGQPPSNQPESETIADARVYTGPCLRDPGGITQSGIGVALATAFIGNALDRVGAALKKGGEDKVTTKSAHRNLEIEPLVKPTCVQYVAGDFDPNMSDRSELLILESAPKDDLTIDALDALLSANGISAPSFVFEGILLPSDDRSALTLRPSFYSYRKSLSGSSSSKDRALVLALSVYDPGKTPTDKSAAATSFVIGKSRPAEDNLTTYHLGSANAPSAFDTPWFPNYARPIPDLVKKKPKPTETVVSEAGADARVPPPTIPRRGGAKPKTPKIMTIALTETTKGDRVLKALSDIFSATEDDLKKAAGNSLIPSLISSADDEAFKANQNATAQYYTAISSAETALAIFCASGSATPAERRSKATAVFVEQTKANVASLATDFPQPYVSLIDPSGATFSSVCEGR